MGKYTVRGGDSWSSIATRLYGEHSRMLGVLMRANPNIFTLHPGDQLVIPKKQKDPYMSEQELHRQPYEGAAGYNRQGVLEGTIPGLNTDVQTAMDIVRNGQQSTDQLLQPQTPTQETGQTQSYLDMRNEYYAQNPEVQAALQSMIDAGVPEEKATLNNLIYASELETGDWKNIDEDRRRFYASLYPSAGEQGDGGLVDGFASGVIQRAEERRLAEVASQQERGTENTDNANYLQAASQYLHNMDFNENIPPQYRNAYALQLQKEMKKKEEEQARLQQIAEIERNTFYTTNAVGAQVMFVPAGMTHNALTIFTEDIAPVLDAPPNYVGYQIQQTPLLRAVWSAMRTSVNFMGILFWETVRKASDARSSAMPDAAPYNMSAERMLYGDQMVAEDDTEIRAPRLGYAYFDTETGLKATKKDWETLNAQDRLELRPISGISYTRMHEALSDMESAWTEFTSDPGGLQAAAEREADPRWQEMYQRNLAEIQAPNELIRGLQGLDMGGAPVQAPMGTDLEARARDMANMEYSRLIAADSLNEAASLRVQARPYLEYIHNFPEIYNPTNEQLAQYEEFFDRAYRLTRTAVDLEVSTFGPTSRAFAFTWEVDSQQYEAFLHAATELSMQMGRPLNQDDYYKLKDYFVDPITEIAGQMVLDPTNWITLDFFKVPLKAAGKELTEAIGKGIMRVLKEAAEAEADDIIARVIKGSATFMWNIGKATVNQARASAITKLTNGLQSAMLIITRQVDKVLGDAGSGNLGDVIDLVVRGIRSVSDDAGELTVDALKKNLDTSMDLVPYSLRDGHIKRIKATIDALFNHGEQNLSARAASVLKAVRPENWGTIINKIGQDMYNAEVERLTAKFVSEGMTAALAREEAGRAAGKWIATQKNEIMRAFSDKIRSALRGLNVNEPTGLMKDNLLILAFGEDFFKEHKLISSSIKSLQTWGTIFRNAWVESVLSFNPRWAMRNWIDSTFRAVVTGRSPYESMSLIWSQLTDLSKNLGAMASDLGMESMAEAGENFSRMELSAAEGIAQRLIRGDYTGIHPAFLPVRLMWDEFTRMRGEGITNPLRLLYKSWTGGWSDFSSALEMSLRARMIHTEFFRVYEALDTTAIKKVEAALRALGADDDTVEIALQVYRRAGTDTDKMGTLLKSLGGESVKGRMVQSMFISDTVMQLAEVLTPAERHLLFDPIHKQIVEMMTTGMARNESPEVIIGNLFDSLLKILDDEDVLTRLGTEDARDLRFSLTSVLSRNPSELAVSDADELVHIITQEERVQARLNALTEQDVLDFQGQLEDISEGYSRFLTAGPNTRVKEHTVAGLGEIAARVRKPIEGLEKAKQKILRLTDEFEMGTMDAVEYQKQVMKTLTDLYNDTKHKKVSDLIKSTRELLNTPVIPEPIMIQLTQREVAEEMTAEAAEKLAKGEVDEPFDEFERAMTEGMTEDESKAIVTSATSSVRRAGEELEKAHGELTDALKGYTDRVTELTGQTTEALEGRATKLKQATQNRNIREGNQLNIIHSRVENYVRETGKLRYRVQRAFLDAMNPMAKTGTAMLDTWALYHGIMENLYNYQSRRAKVLLDYVSSWTFDATISDEELIKRLDMVVGELYIGDFLANVGILPTLGRETERFASLRLAGNGKHFTMNNEYQLEVFFNALLGKEINFSFADSGANLAKMENILTSSWLHRHDPSFRKTFDLEKVKGLRKSGVAVNQTGTAAAENVLRMRLPQARLQLAYEDATENLHSVLPGLTEPTRDLNFWASFDDAGNPTENLLKIINGELDASSVDMDDPYVLAAFASFGGTEITPDITREELLKAAQDGYQKFIDEVIDDPTILVTAELASLPLDEIDELSQHIFRMQADQMLNTLNNATNNQIRSMQWWEILKGKSHKSNEEHTNLMIAVLEKVKKGIVPENRTERNMYNRLRTYMADSMRSGSYSTGGGMVTPPHPHLYRMVGDDETADALTKIWMQDFGARIPPEELAQRAMQTNVAQLRDSMWKTHLKSSPVFQVLRERAPKNVLKSPESLKEWLGTYLSNMEEGPLRDTFEVYYKEIENFMNTMTTHAKVTLGLPTDVPRLMVPWDVSMQPNNWLQWLYTSTDTELKFKAYREVLTTWKEELLEQMKSGTVRGLIPESQYDLISSVLLDLGVKEKNNAIEIAMNGSNGASLEGLGDIEGALPRTQRVMVDYTEYSQLDQTIKAIYPFWMFTKSSIPMWLDLVTTRPALIAYYERYMQTSRRFAKQAGAVTSEGEVLPSMNGFIPIPGTDTWVDLTASLSIRTIMPDRRMYWHDTDDLNFAQKVTMMLYDTGSYFGMSLPPWITGPLFAVGALDENVVPTSSLVPQANLIPKWVHLWIEEKLSQTSPVLGQTYRRAFSPAQSWEDWAVEEELLKMAMEWMDAGVDVDQVQARVQEALGYRSSVTAYTLSHPETTPEVPYTLAPRRDSEWWMEAERRAFSQNYNTTLIGFFTGIYPKSFTDADARIIQIRTNINMLRDTLNNQIGSAAFGLDPHIEERWKRYTTTKYDTSEGWINNMYGAMRWVRTPEGETPNPQQRREIMAQTIHEENVTNAYHEAKGVAYEQLQARLSTLDIGADSSMYWQIYQDYFAAIAQIEAHPYYVDAYRATTSGYKPRQVIENEMRDLFYRLIRESAPKYEEGDSYESYAERKAQWEQNLQVYAQALGTKFDLILYDYIGGGRGMTMEDLRSGVVQTYLGQDFNVQKFIDGLIRGMTSDSYTDWQKSKDTPLDALNSAWQELYWNPYWDAIGGLSGRERQLAERLFLESHPEPPTPVELAAWVLENYQGRWTLEELVEQATLPDVEIKSIEDRQQAVTGPALVEAEVWNRLASIPPGKTSEVIDYMIALEDKDVESGIDLWYESGGNSSAWSDPADFAKFARALFNALDYLQYPRPSTQQMAEWAEAQNLNDEFNNMVTSSLGDRFFDELALYYRMGTADRRVEYRRNPRIKAYYELRDQWGENFQMWSKWYNQDTYHGGEVIQPSGAVADIIGSSTITPDGMFDTLGDELAIEIENMLTEEEPLSEDAVQFIESTMSRHPEWREFLALVLQANDGLY